MMNDKIGISIFIYSYQKNDLYEYVESLLNNLDENYIYEIKIVDQNNINRSDSFKSFLNKSVFYEYIIWDSINSPILKKQEFAKKTKNKYIMYLSDGILPLKNFYKDCINMIEEDPCIISGHGKINFIKENQFLNKKNVTISNKYYLNNYIDRYLIFCKTEIFNKISFPHHLKYLGEEEFMTVDAIKSGYKILSCPSNNVLFDFNSIEKSKYIPFSIFHKYNSFIEYYINNKKEFFDENYENLRSLTFDGDDVLYDRMKSKFDKVLGIRYINKTNRIN